MEKLMVLICMPGLKVDRLDSGGRNQCREYGGMQELNMNNGNLEISSSVMSVEFRAQSLHPLENSQLQASPL